jgi:hypothetical protein
MELIVMLLLLLMVNQPPQRQGNNAPINSQSMSIESVVRQLLAQQAVSAPPAPSLGFPQNADPFLQPNSSQGNTSASEIASNLGSSSVDLGTQLYSGDNSTASNFGASSSLVARPESYQPYLEELIRAATTAQHGLATSQSLPSPVIAPTEKNVSSSNVQSQTSPKTDLSRKSSGVKKHRKEQEMPVRPRTAYNFFFQEQREAILNQNQNRKRKSDCSIDDHQKRPFQGSDRISDNDIDDRKPSATLSREPDKNELQEQQQQQQQQQRQIGFQELGKIIGKKWHTISSDAKARYQTLADLDRQRYDHEMKIWKEHQQDELTRKQAALESLVDAKTREEYLKSGGEVSKLWKRNDDTQGKDDSNSNEVT